MLPLFMQFHPFWCCEMFASVDYIIGKITDKLNTA